MNHISAFRQKESIPFEFLNLFMSGVRLLLLHFCSFSFWRRNLVQDQSQHNTNLTPFDQSLLTSNSNKKLRIPKGSKGFTLVEVIVVILIMGILVVFMSAGTARIIEGYLFTRSNVDTALKAQIAISRIIKEFRAIDNIKSGNHNSITYSYHGQPPSPQWQTLSWSGSDNDYLLLRGNILIDHVNEFKLIYYDDYTKTTNRSTWKKGKSNMIGITLKLNVAFVQDPLLFSTRIMPRYQQF